MSKKATRLFESFQPETYDLNLALNKKELTFKGTVIIKGKKVGRPSKRITLHQKNLQITSARMSHHTKDGVKEVPVSRILSHKAYHEVRLHSDELLRAGMYTLELEFSGVISDSMLGIYPSRYMHEGKEEIIIATQFESHYAREAFPCIDEPEAKAVFNVTLQTHKGDVVLSNTPIKSQSHHKDVTTTVFEPSPRMSTYLLAFVTGPLHSVEKKTKDGTVVSTWSSLARSKRELEYATNEAVAFLEFFTDYFKTPYPLAKCDQVALPDFDAGAMENWGLITYREIALLTDPDNRSISNEQYVSLVIAHELSHQWFGNLVTMKWWDDLWLNESFASIMEYIALDAVHPDWKVWESYTSLDVVSTTSRDTYKDIQPVGVKVDDPDLLSTLFDPGIVYTKGGRLLKMVREYIGDNAFRDGLADYFKQHAYSNTTRDDLWNALSKSAKRDLASLMLPWIEQPGMPMVSVQQENKKLLLRQKRFMFDSQDDTQLWPIPLLASQQLSMDVLSKRHQTILSETNDPVLLNTHASGHYVTQYQLDSQNAFIAQKLKNQEITTEGRINILNDSLLLARHGSQSIITPLNLVKELSSEDRDSVWALMSRIIATASQLSEGNEVVEESIKLFRAMLAREWYNKLGWDDKNGDNANTKQLRHTVLAFMLAAEDASTIKEGLGRYESVKKIEDLPAEIRASILSTAVRHGKADVIDQLMRAYPNAPADIQLDIVNGLSAVKECKKAESILQSALGPEGFVRPQDIVRWIILFIRSKYTRQIAWDWLVNNWSWIEETLGESKSYDYVPTYVASAMNSKQWKKNYHTFFEPLRENKILKHNISIGYADVASRVAWRERDEANIQAFFKNLSKKPLQ